MDYNGYRYNFACNAPPKPDDDNNGGGGGSGGNGDNNGTNVVPDEPKTKDELRKYLAPTPQQVFSDAGFYEALEWIINIMLWSSGFGTFAWPVWVILGAVIEGYNFIMFWSGLWKVMTAD